MKKGRLVTSLGMIALTLAISSTAIAQGQRGPRGQRFQANTDRPAMREGRNAIQDRLDLTDDQKEQMSKIRAEHQKEMRYEQSLLNEKNAHLRTLLSAPEKDETAINNTIDQIAGMKAGLMKKQIANREEIKGILTAEQIEKMEELGYGNGLRQGLRGNRGPGQGQGMRGGFGPQKGGFGPERGVRFHGNGLNCPYN
jgi:Spy/CpxP family protein refolding chaperone